jgi:NAD-specific glutamate dehydrogenase
MLDLLLPNSDIVDHYGLPEYIFCGPDEGTAGK